MPFIFLDESGDLGFDKRKKNSQYFVITILALEDKKHLERTVKKVHQMLRKKIKRLSGGILHSYKEKPETRRRLLNYIAKLDCSVMTICLNKEKVYTNLREEKHVLYNYVANILLDRVMSKKLISSDKDVTLIAAKRETNKFLNENFTSYLQKQAKQNHNIKIHVSIKTPAEEKGLQAVDFVSWSIFNKYENNNVEYYDLVRKIIVEENKLYS